MTTVLTILPQIGYGTVSDKVCIGYAKKYIESYARGVVDDFETDLENLVLYHLKELNLEQDLDGLYLYVLQNSMYMYVEKNGVGKIQNTYLQTNHVQIFKKGELNAFLVKKQMLGVKLYGKERDDLMNKKEAIEYVKQIAPKILFQDILSKFISRTRLKYEKFKNSGWENLNTEKLKNQILSEVVTCYFATRDERMMYFYRYQYRQIECGAIAMIEDDEDCFNKYLNFLYLDNHINVYDINNIHGTEMRFF